MSGESVRFSCSRCGIEFPLTAVHTEIARRDFIESPQPATIEYLCRDCLEAYVEDFLGSEFDGPGSDTAV